MATTPILGLPLIDRNMFADVPKDMNALAKAIDDAVGPLGAIALKSEVDVLKRFLDEHTRDNIKHITTRERVAWNKAVLDLERTYSKLGDLNQLPTNNKTSIVAAINEVFTDIDNGLKGVANAVTDKGVYTPPNAGFATIIQNISRIQTGRKQATGYSFVAGSELIVSGYSFVPKIIIAAVVGTYPLQTAVYVAKDQYSMYVPDQDSDLYTYINPEASITDKYQWWYPSKITISDGAFSIQMSTGTLPLNKTVTWIALGDVPI
ncbi:hypothetical protein ACTHOQ_13890 [Solibacillus silvestris]|uniref:hypothetical protein n=1 Tax=Solibacillus silvestris TaxID=76853 RepID=UPI003F812E54